MASRVLVTGGAGFVGEHLLDRLVRAGHDVRALVHIREPTVPQVEQVRGDLNDDESLYEALRGVDQVVHCAALLDPVSDAREAACVNHLASVRLARLALDAGVDTFVFLSSIAAIGFRQSAGLVDEAVACAPTTIYGRSKRDAELGLLGVSGALRMLILRPPTVYGPGERRNFLALARAVESGRIFLPGAAKNRMSFCHVDNLTAAVATLLAHQTAHGIVHVADEPAVTFEQVVGTLGVALGKPRRPPRVPLAVARGVSVVTTALCQAVGREPPLPASRLRTLTADFALDTRSSRRLGVASEVTFEDGVRDTVDWYRREGLLPQRARRRG